MEKELFLSDSAHLSERDAQDGRRGPRDRTRREAVSGCREGRDENAWGEK